jgi:phosphoribosylformimino-5-aminoimidazole carboxamide ribotide isomerase
MRIIPAIDIIGGKCVRLTQGDYSRKTTYYENPLEVALMFEDQGIKYLHLVDLDGAKSAHIVNHSILEKIAGKTNLKVDFGGGLKTDEDVRIAFESGAEQITGGTIAVKNRKIFESWIHEYGSDKIILGSDVHNRKIAVSGWEEETDLEIVPFLKNYIQKGVKYTICTDTSLDGMLQGPAIALYTDLLEETKNSHLNLIASGGIRNLQDLRILEKLGCEGAIIGKAIYEETIKLSDLATYIQKENLQ